MQTIDTEEMVVGYPSMMDVMLDIKGMGENNSSWNRKLNLRRDVIYAASAIYNQLYGRSFIMDPSTGMLLFRVREAFCPRRRPHSRPIEL